MSPRAPICISVGRVSRVGLVGRVGESTDLTYLTYLTHLAYLACCDASAGIVVAAGTSKSSLSHTKSFLLYTASS